MMILTTGNRGATVDSCVRSAATLADVGSVVAFVVSDLAQTMTATKVNMPCGALMDELARR